MAEKLKWKDDRAESSLGGYVLNKARIRNGKRYETEYEVCLDGKVIGISDTKASGKTIAQSHYNVKRTRKPTNDRYRPTSSR